MEYEECTLMFLVLSFNGINMYYQFYCVLLKYKFPKYISKYIIEAMFSVGVKVQQKIETWQEVNSKKYGKKFERFDNRKYLKQGAGAPPVANS